ncbi:MAG: polymer-forming cytoskeletal protein [Proteobacteria bacterium]|nr:polymer-forming cytoskeletal protein [Pseudomonadota bacterium]
MFNQKKQEKLAINNEKTKPSVEVLTFLGMGTEFKGKIIFQGTLRIDGLVEGEIEGNDTLTLGENGIVKGVCKVGKAVISGKFRGDLFVDEKIILKSNADVEGKIVTPSLIIEEGAHFNGTCRMVEPKSREVNKELENEESQEIVRV